MRWIGLDERHRKLLGYSEGDEKLGWTKKNFYQKVFDRKPEERGLVLKQMISKQYSDRTGLQKCL
jgi:hypothetical protein